jgi:hypothetical protein
MMHFRSTFISVVFFSALLFLSFNLSAASNSQIFTFEKQELHIAKVSGYDLVQYGQLDLSQEIGAPQLPIKIVQILLPPGKEISEIEIITLDSEEIEGEYHVFPSQPPQVLSDPNVRFTQPNQSFYAMRSAFPEKLGKLTHQGSLAGYNIASVIIYPVQCLPSEKKLIFHKRIQIEYDLRESSKSNVSASLNQRSRLEIQQSLERVIDNTSLLKEYPIERISLSGIEHLYVIITNNTLKPSFQPLADWKAKKGLSAKIVTTTEIYSTYPGVDNQEKIRNFIKYAYQNWGTMWILLGGDSHIIPDRKAYAMDCEYGPPTDNFIPCDLYYSDLDGDWNADGNTTYGEVADR